MTEKKLICSECGCEITREQADRADDPADYLCDICDIIVAGETE
jgi:hypothetical protein